LNCIIIDDESTARAIVSHLCSQVPDLDVIEEFTNAISAIKFLNKNDIDLIFLDLHMPDYNGFDFIETLKDPPKIILTTSDREFAIDAFGYDCILDYLLKPITFPRFLKSVKKAENEKAIPVPLVSIPSKSNTNDSASAMEKEMYVNIDRRLVKIEFEGVYLIEAKGDYILIKTENKNYTVHSTLKKIEEKLPCELFLKVHRSYIININKIIDIEDNSVLIAKNVIPISRSNRPELMRRLNLL
jgi:DNA-binding LytR/AlgR family response regulator